MLRTCVVLACSVALLAFVTAVPATSAETSDTYTWHGEFVSFDDATRTITLKSRLAYQDTVSAVSRFKAADRVLLHWSGFDASADAVRDVLNYDAARLSKERFLFPAEIVSTETPNQYLTFRFRIPDAAVAEVKSLKAGEWVTVTSRHRPTNEANAVAAVRPYVTGSAKTSTN